ncbi:MAG: DUF1653 domain-containing protein [bacterium]
MNIGDFKLGICRHYKGPHYKVLTLARLHDTYEEVVIYEALFDIPDFGDHAVWVRPVSGFLEEVVVDGVCVPRFEWIGENEDA